MNLFGNIRHLILYVEKLFLFRIGNCKLEISCHDAIGFRI